MGYWAMALYHKFKEVKQFGIIFGMIFMTRFNLIIRFINLDKTSGWY